MRKRIIGTSDLIVSELGVGCMSFPLDQQQTTRIVDQAIDAGINFFDTADLYQNGRNEEQLGQALKNKRHQVIIATKVGNRMNADGDSWRWDPSKRWIKEAVKNSLQRLQTDYIDLYQLHGGTMEDDANEIIETFEQLKKEGLIRHYGISSIRPNVIHRFLTSSHAASVMMQYSLLDRRPEEWFPMIQQSNASVITRGTLAKGLLTSQALDRFDKLPSVEAYTADELQTTIQQLRAETTDLHAAAIGFVLTQPVVATALVGASSVQQLQESINAYHHRPAATQISSIQKLVKLAQYEQHRKIE